MKQLPATPKVICSLLALICAGFAHASTTYSYRLPVAGIKAAPVVSLENPVLGSFTAPTRFLVNGPFALSAPTSTSTGAFSFSSSDPTVATVSSTGVVTPLKAGATLITAAQATAGTFGAASKSTTLNVVSNPSEFVTWDPAQTGSNIYLSGGNLIASGGANSRAGSRGTFGVSSGKWYWEETVQGNSGGSCWIAGISDSRVAGGAYAQANSFVFSPGFSSWNAWAGTTEGASTFPAGASGGTYMFALDMDNGSLYIGLNGTWLNSAQPTSGTQHIGATISGLTGTAYPQVNFYQGGACGSTTTTANFGASAFKHAVPANFNPGLYR